MVCLWKCSTSPWWSLKQLKHPNLTHGTARLLSLSGIHGRRTEAWRCVSVRIICSVHLLIAQLPVPDATLSSPRWRAVMKAFAQDSADNHNLFKNYLFLNQKIKVRKKEKKTQKKKKKKKGKKDSRNEESNRLPPLTSLSPTPSRWAKMVNCVLVLSDFAMFVPHKSSPRWRYQFIILLRHGLYP